jgi:Rrf2 family protein
MRLSKASAYAVFATVHVAKHQQHGPVQGRVIAEACGIPVEYLLKILQQLVRFQVLDSETGRRGGFLLKNDPEQTTLLQIVEAIDGPMTGELSVRKEITGDEAVKDIIEGLCQEAAQATQALLRKTTVGQLLVSSVT